jgi:hypothetical protein
VPERQGIAPAFATGEQRLPRFHFHIHDGVDRPDPEGTEFPDLHAAWSEAVRACGEMLREIDGELDRNTEWRMDVTDEAGQALLTLRFTGTDHASRNAEDAN